MDETAQLLTLLLAGVLCVGVLAVAWRRNRAAWRRRDRADRAWLTALGVDPGTERRDPAAWRLVLTDELGTDGTFTLDVQQEPLGTFSAPTGSSPAPGRGGWPCR